MSRRKIRARNPAKKLPHPCENCGEFTPIGEGDHICGFDPMRMPVSEYVPTDDYFWFKGKHFVSRGDG